MAKKSQNSDMVELLLLHAAEQVGYVLKPYPKGMDAHEVDQVVDNMRTNGLVHGTRRDPNLTRDGIDRARALVE